jgi:hypothetical protein
MLVRRGNRIYPEVPAKAEPADDILTSDYYTRLPQIRLTGNSTGRPMQPETPTEVMLDGNDVANLVECAIRQSYREYAICRVSSYLESSRLVPANFPVRSPSIPGVTEIRKIVAEELDKCSSTPASAPVNRIMPAVETLLPRMPLPAHLQGRRK